MTDKAGLEERKIIIYLIDKQLVTQVNGENQATKSGSTFYEKYKQTDADFEVVLIGLDGGEKLRQADILTRQKLYALIDGMPMRRAEMRRKN